jgi:ribonuclease J
MSSELKIVPLGGLGTIGMNCLALEQADGILVIDCGIAFATEDLGIDAYHPLFTYLAERRDRLSGVFLTHGHEDHVGALPYLLARVKLPVWGLPHSLAVARRRLADRGLDLDEHQLISACAGDHFAIGPFGVEPLRVTHSIVDAAALAIRTAAGMVVHTGDFRFEAGPGHGDGTDEARLANLGSEGVRLLLSDSTNIDAPSPKTNEADVGKALDDIVRTASGRVVIAMFASNVQRLKLIGDIAQRLGRKVALFGRSMQSTVELAHRTGHLAWPSDLVVGRDDAAGLAPGRLLVLTGGTQAEPGSGLMKLASQTHVALALAPPDTVVFSSRIIPGNDPAVFTMMGDFLRQGITVRNWITDPDVHVSGHAHRDEQEKMIRLVRPRGFVPIHGTRHHLARHADLARALRVPEVLVLENGDIGVVNDRGLCRGDRVPAGKVATWNGEEVPETVLQERRSLARGGSLFVSVVVDRHGHLAATPVVLGRGIAGDDRDPSAFRTVAIKIAKAFALHAEGASDDNLAELARLAARRAIEAMTGKKPVTLVAVTRV